MHSNRGRIINPFVYLVASSVRGRSPALPPSSPPIVEYDTSVVQQDPQSPLGRRTQSEHLLSPEVARLPPPRTPASVQSRQRDTSSEYYTAAWGSPYDHSPSSRSARTAPSEQAYSEDLSASSPGPEFGLEHLVPRHLGDFSALRPAAPRHSVSEGAPAEFDPDSTPRSRTKRWVQLPRREEEPEKAHWWSDESRHTSPDRESKGHRRTSSTKAVRQSAPFGHRSRESNRTLDQQTFWQKLREQRKPDMSGLYSSRWAATPPQDDDVIAQPSQDKTIGLSASRWADTPPMPDDEEKPVQTGLTASRWADTPPLPEADTMAGEGAERMVGGSTSLDPSTPSFETSEGGVEQEAREDHDTAESSISQPLREVEGQSADLQLDVQVASAVSETPVNGKEGTTTLDGLTETSKPEVDDAAKYKIVPVSPTKRRPESTRVKKRVSWRGKTCTIQIPDLDYTEVGFAPASLSEARSRYTSFEDAGYDISGFDIAPENDSSNGPVHVRPIFPDEAESHATGRQHGAHVLLPDLNRWKAYMDHLTERKLAALGVSLGGDEPVSAGAQDMSRQSSAQYPPLPFSPPVPTGSTNSMGRPGMVRGHSHTMSVASPISPLNGAMGHMHRHSTFTGAFPFQPQFQQQAQQPTLQGSRTFSPPSQQFPQQTNMSGLRSFSPQLQQSPQPPVLPGMQSFSPQGQFTIPGYNRTGSPAQLAALRSEVGAVRGPGSPLSQAPFAQSPMEYTRPQLPPAPNTFVPHAGSIPPTAMLPELPEEDDEDELLQEAEPEPQSQAEMQPETPTYVPPHKRAQLNANIAVPTPRGHRHNISEGLERDILDAEKRHEVERQDWIEVYEESDSLQSGNEVSRLVSAALPPEEKDPLSQGISVQESVHNHKRSGSRLPGSTQAFKFNPGASFQPSSAGFTFGAPAPKANGQPSFTHSRNKSSNTFNVAAPEFKPSGLPALPKSDFNFSATGPVFKPNAPAFQPAKPQQHESDQPTAIFGKVEIPEIVKPARRNKAIAIVRPDATESRAGSGTDPEDSEGRIAQSEDRLKRQRKFGGDGDEVPRFAEPTPMPAPSDFVLKSQSEPEPQQTPPIVNGEESDGIAEKRPSSYRIADVVDLWTPPDSSRSVEPDIQKPTSHGHKHSSSLSALAKPFQPFGPPTEQLPAHEPSKSFDSISELEEGELRDDGHPPTSPLAHQEPLIDSDSNGRPVSPLPELQSSFDQPPSARVATVADAEPSFDEIDAVMRQLNEVDEPREVPDVNVSPLSSAGAHPMEGVTYLPEWSRSDAPSPSPRRREIPLVPHADSSFTIHDRTDSNETPMNGWPEINRLNKNEDAPASDWSGFFSAQDEEKLQHRGQFFDSHIERLIGDAVERRLQPLEESLRTIEHSVSNRPTSRDLAPKRSSSAVDSDADDEDESDEQRHRPISRGKEKRIDQIKAAVLEALREQSPHQASHSAQDLQELHSVLADMKMSFARAASAGLELEDIRAVVEETVHKQNQALVPVTVDEGERAITHKREVSELEGRLNETLAGALEEANRRHAAEEREVETKRSLRFAEEELQLLRDSASDNESRLRAAEEQREELHRRAAKAEEAHRDTREQVTILEAEHEAAQATLVEYRMSSTKWRQDIDKATRDREDLETTVATLEQELEESQEMGGSMRRRLEKLHADMATAAGQLASEKASRQAKEEEYRSRCEHLEAQQGTQSSDRTQLDEELRALRNGTAEAVEMKVAFEQMKVSNASLEEMVGKLQVDLVEQQSLAARYERDFNDAREAGRSEVERTRTSMETDIEAANHQVNVVRMELESELSKVRAELENVRMEAETAKARHERHLEEEDDSRRENLRKVNHASSVALDEARQKHEVSISELRSAHNRALDHALEDKQRSEHFLNERLSLSDAKLQHFQDRVLHLEERLAVTKSAAQAAAMSVQSKSITASATNALPEKISPQALRESILALQEQLQERESTIDKLQNQVDKEGPAEIKKRDDEIAWLRELLAVRSEELTDLVNTLAQPTFDRASVRDTAIRIRANLQMEKQEKERSGQGSQSLPGQAIASLSNFATPRATQFFDKWRSSMESSALRTAPRASGRPRSSTPSKAPVASSKMPPGYAAGLMTPPASNLRSTPSPEATGSLPAPRLQSRAGGKPNSISLAEPPRLHNRQPSVSSEAPTTPLFRSQSYDQDAEDSSVHMQSFDDEDLDVADNQPPAFRSLEDELDATAGDDDMA